LVGGIGSTPRRERAVKYFKVVFKNGESQTIEQPDNATPAGWWSSVKDSVFKTVPLNGKKYLKADIVRVSEAKVNRA
jgi:hypothetical protein